MTSTCSSIIFSASRDRLQGIFKIELSVGITRSLHTLTKANVCTKKLSKFWSSDVVRMICSKRNRQPITVAASYSEVGCTGCMQIVAVWSEFSPSKVAVSWFVAVCLWFVFSVRGTCPIIWSWVSVGKGFSARAKSPSYHSSSLGSSWYASPFLCPLVFCFCFLFFWVFCIGFGYRGVCSFFSSSSELFGCFFFIAGEFIVNQLIQSN